MPESKNGHSLAIFSYSKYPTQGKDPQIQGFSFTFDISCFPRTSNEAPVLIWTEQILISWQTDRIMCEDKLSRIKDCVAIKSEIKPSRTRKALDKHRLQNTYSNLIFILMISHSSCWMEKIKRVDCLWKRWGLYQVYMYVAKYKLRQPFSTFILSEPGSNLGA